VDAHECDRGFGLLGECNRKLRSFNPLACEFSALSGNALGHPTLHALSRVVSGQRHGSGKPSEEHLSDSRLQHQSRSTIHSNSRIRRFHAMRLIDRAAPGESRKRRKRYFAKRWRVTSVSECRVHVDLTQNPASPRYPKCKSKSPIRTVRELERQLANRPICMA